MLQRPIRRLAQLALVFATSAGALAQLELPDKPVEQHAKDGKVEIKPGPPGNLAKKQAVPEKSNGVDTSRANDKLDLPAGSTAPAAAPAPAGATPSSAPAPATPVASQPAAPAVAPLPNTAAAFVLGEVRKAKELNDPLLPRAVESLTRMGDPGRDAARVALAEDHAPSVLVGARVLLGTGRADDAESVQRRLRQRLPSAACAPLVDALVELDPVHASPQFLLELLAHQQSAVRNAAQRHLDARTDDLPLATIASLCAAKESDTRVRAVQLASRINGAGATAILLDRLADSSPMVARQAVNALALREDEGLDRELLRRAFGGQWVLRSEAYALLAIIEREDRGPRAILDEVNTRKLLDGMGANETFVAGACAAALAGLGFRSGDPSATAWLDLEVPHRLVRVVTAEDFSPDFGSLSEIAARRLTLITGQTFGSDGPGWMHWWTDSAGSFHARRATLPARVEEVPSLRVSVVSNAEPPEAFALLGPAFAAREADASSSGLQGEIVYLSEIQARSLFDVLQAQAVFAAERLPGLRGSPNADGCTLTVAIAGGEKSFRFAGSKSEDWFARAVEAARSLRDRNRWQRYADGAKYATPRDLWRAENAWWDQPLERAERDRRLADLVLAYLAHKSPSERDGGLAELARVQASSGVLGANDFSALLVLLRGEHFTGPRAKTLVELAIACGRDTAPAVTGAAPEAARTPAPLRADAADNLIKAVVDTFGAEGAELVSNVMQTGRDLTRRYTAAPEPLLRAIAAATLARGATADDVALLMKMLADESEDVEAAAVLALGENHVEAARTELTLRARVGKPRVRANALVAVGMLGGSDALDVLLHGLTQRDDPALYLAAARGLVAMHDPQTVPLFVSLLSKGAEDPAYEQARRGLIELGERAWPDLLRIVHSPGHKAQREATLVLAEQCVPEAASALMTILTEHRDDARVAEELCVLTCVDHRGDMDPALAWWNWWEYVVHDDAQAWFCGALSRLGVPAATPDEMRKGERVAFDFVFEVLQRDEPYLVERARRELARMLGRDPGPVPQGIADRRSWIATLREVADKKGQ